MSISNPTKDKEPVEIGLSASPASRDSHAEPLASNELAQLALVLSEPQRQALEWLLTEENATVKDAAEFAGVTRATVSRWLNHDPNFRAAFEQWKRNQETVNEAQMVGIEAAALNVLDEAIRKRHDLRAAEFIIKQVTARRKKAESRNSGGSR